MPASGVDVRVDLPGWTVKGPSGENARVKDARVEARARPGASEGVEFRGDLSATVDLTCGRCLTRFDWVLRKSVLLFLVLEAPRTEGLPIGEHVDVHGEPTLEDAAFVADETGRVAMRDVVTEQIYLELPLKAVCSADCRGLCPHCGADLNATTCDCGVQEVDPRLEPLLRLKKDQKL